ncbi:MAG: hypothetical protein Q8J98_07935 [Phaeovulum sp.]|uniref:AsmA-like C-terminal region-containing protein n=1 Tax=Phaeovulum sp. TaxID=2934796 RepID=UPI002730D68A|nr:AsmA-like C-terminal region-containing protein [Phaeovulum sp.]MDP2063021.1 hypothetical protein [Phaeovulum sp.]
MEETQIEREFGSAAVALRPRVPRRRAGRFGLWMLVALPILALLVTLAALYVTHQPLPAPQWVVARLEARANTALAGVLTLHLRGGAELVVTDGLVPRLRFLGVEVAGNGGQVVAQLPEARFTLSREALADWRIVVETVRLDGASLALRRLADGSLDVSLGSDSAALRAATPETLAQALGAFKQVFAAPALAGLQRIEAQGLQIRLDDARLDKVWQVQAGRLTLTQDATRLAVTLGFDIGEADRRPSSVALSLNTRKGSNEASFGAAITAVPARDLALQSPALAWLGVLDVPISGSLRSGIDAAGAVGHLDARLEIGAGALSPVAGIAPVAIRGGTVHLTYDPAAERVDFSELSIDSRALRLRASGSAQLRGFSGGLPEEVLGQVAIANLRVDPEGLFETPVQFVAGALDLRLRLDPFTLDIGQLQLQDGTERIGASGRVAARAEGWQVALDFSAARISQDRLLALWPVNVVAKTRSWLVENVATGELRDVRAALRLEPGAEPQLALGYGFEGAEVRVIDSLPPLLDASGFASIEGNRHSLTVERGHVVAPTGGRIDVADTVLVVPDIRLRPAPAEIRLRTFSTLPAAMSLLDQEPFGFMAKAGMGTDFAQGMARAETVMQMFLKRGLTPDELRFRVSADLTDVRSEVLVPGRLLSAPLLTLTADASGMEIAGRGTLSGVGFDARWRQEFATTQRGVSALEADVQLTPASLAAFGVTLPRGTMSGEGWGKLVLDIRRGQPISFGLTSDLAGIGLAIASVGWRKPASGTGTFAVSGSLGSPPEIDRLSLEAAGLKASGTLTLARDGTLDRAQFGDVTLGGWFDGAVTLRAQRAGNPMVIEVTGERADLRRATIGAGGGGGDAGGPISISLDRLQISDSIALTRFRGDFSQTTGFSGGFSANVNGGARVEGTVMPGQGGRSAFRITSNEAGAVLNSAEIFSRARGGTLDLILQPGSGGPGHFEGTAEIKNLRVVDAPILAALLSAASGIGLLEQLNGEGLLFTDVDGTFTISPETITLTKGAAVGASLGVSGDGVYAPGSGALDFQGVLTPLYLINGIGQIISRRGEGFFGISYRLRGTSADPQITVNPLSLLTPGFLRDIFRKPSPGAGQ